MLGIVMGFIVVVATLMLVVTYHIVNLSIKESLLPLADTVEELKTREHKHDAQVSVIWEGFPVPCFITDDSGVKIARVNQAYLDFWGFTNRLQAQTDEWLDQLVEDKRELALERMSQITANHEYWVFDNHLKDGRVVRFLGYPIWEDAVHETGFQGYSGLLLDITKTNDAQASQN